MVVRSTFVEAYSHVLVYWPLESSVTSVDTTAISNGGQDIGSNCIITIKKEHHEGRIAAKGKTKHVQLFVQYLTRK